MRILPILGKDRRTKQDKKPLNFIKSRDKEDKFCVI